MFSTADPELQAFAARLRLVGECWEYSGPRRGGPGYRGHKKSYAHRYAYEQLVGPIPPKHDIDHLCRNRACCNPAHLEPVTRLVNLQRGHTSVARGWIMREFPHEHDRKASYKTGRKAGWPRCQQCIDTYNRNYWARKRAG